MALVQNIQRGDKIRLFAASTASRDAAPENKDDTFGVAGVVNDVSLEWSSKTESEKAATKASPNYVSLAGFTEITLKLTAQTLYNDMQLQLIRNVVGTQDPVWLQIRDVTGAVANQNGSGWTTPPAILLEGDFIVVEESVKAETKGVMEVTLSLEAAGEVKRAARAYQPYQDTTP
ncbi:hypothetical protein [Caulobacter sp. FWC2]|uniref:hypothetical protein n=1 Tax=Caulobacter sp. FWC2 TaxID=69664 RepID=UPI000C15AE23|nr:hypothetical protein [Caulobacter sp. FWC2]PIB90996.1 hypothetical protein CSW62_05070 [Caulobacter sp. FWC2]